MKSEPPTANPLPGETPPRLPNTPFYATIRSVESFSDDDRRVYENGGYPVHVSSHLEEHETFADYLIDRSLDAWTRSQD